MTDVCDTRKTFRRRRLHSYEWSLTHYEWDGATSWKNGNVVGVGVVDTSFECGNELHQLKLCPFEIAVRVTHALHKSEWVGEMVGKLLIDCLHKVI